MIACFLLSWAKPTNDPEDVFDGRNEYNQQVNKDDETDCNDDVPGPVERLIREEDLQQGPADLWALEKKVHCFVTNTVVP